MGALLIVKCCLVFLVTHLDLLTLACSFDPEAVILDN